jgi:RimJ/RimL family protein N-acetyltransferase
MLEKIEIRQLKYRDLRKVENFIIKNKMGISPKYNIKMLKFFFIPYKIFSIFPKFFPKLQYIFVFELNEKIIGLLMATNLDLSKEVWYIYNGIIDKNYRKRGNFTKLLNYTINFLKDNFNAKKIIGDVNERNKISLNLFKKLNFKQYKYYRIVKKLS